MPLTNTPETLNILNPDFRMPEHCGGDRWSILHGDSLRILRQFEPNSFDAIITDPPYASGGSSQTTKNRSTNEKYSSMSKEKALRRGTGIQPARTGGSHQGLRPHCQRDYGVVKQKRRTIMVRRKYYA